MSKLRENYESTAAGKLQAFVEGRGEVLEEQLEKGILTVERKLDLDEEKRRDEIFSEEVDYNRIVEREAEFQKKGARLLDKLYPIGALIIGLAIMATLVIATTYMPRYGNPGNPVNNEVPARYIEHGMEETGTVNVVTGLILNYRGFDTMGETHVLFIAATTVMILLLMTKKGTIGIDYKEDRAMEPKNDTILQMVATFLIPIIAVFGIYVILNGHISPGGGFSGGAILGAGMILYVSAFGFKKTEKFFNEEVYKVAKVTALCCYVCCLSYYFYMGANGFNNHIPLGTPGRIISSGLILFIDIFVGVEVACTMYAFYALFRRGEI